MSQKPDTKNMTSVKIFQCSQIVYMKRIYTLSSKQDNETFLISFFLGTYLFYDIYSKSIH